MRSSHQIAWLWSRLRAMSAAEVGWRLRAHVGAAWEARAAGRERFRPLRAPEPREVRTALRRSLAPLVPATAWRATLEREFPAYAGRLRSRARRIRDGETPLFDAWYETGPSPDWHLDPATGRGTPRVAAARLDYRDRERVSDARRVWELHRHHHLVEVALAAWLDRDAAAMAYAAGEVSRWCDENPPLLGIGWTSSLELAIRTLNWAHLLALASEFGDEAVDDETLARVAGAWIRQVQFVRRHDSRYSSANNHRIGEAAAVAAAGAFLPFHSEAAAWWQWGREVLERELLTQVLPDGVGAEQAFAYQRFVLDFAALVLILARERGDDFAPEVLERLQRAYGFLDAVTRPDGSVFAVGDDDEGRVLTFAEELDERTLGTLQLGSRLFDRPEWRHGNLPRAGWWSLGEDPGSSAPEAPSTGLASPPAPASASQTLTVRRYPAGGYAVVGTAGERPMRLVFDAGPLGFGSLAAHGHADALSLNLWEGEDLLADAGTGSYHGEPSWREVLRATAAHNTATIDERDQSEARGLFLWGARAEARLLAAGADGGWFVLAGEHDGYAAAGVPVTRRLVLGARWAEETLLLVVDELFGSGRHGVRVPWHAGAAESSLVATPEGPLWEARYASGVTLLGRAAFLATAAAAPAGDAGGGGDVGDEAPATRLEEAWISRRFGTRQRQARCVLSGTVTLPAAAVWVLRTTRQPQPTLRGLAPSLRACAGGLGAMAEGAGGIPWRALVTHPGEAAVEEQGVRLDGRAAAWAEGGGAGLHGRAAVAGARRFQSGLFEWSAGAQPLTGILRARPEASSFESGPRGEAGA